MQSVINLARPHGFGGMVNLYCQSFRCLSCSTVNFSPRPSNTFNESKKPQQRVLASAVQPLSIPSSAISQRQFSLSSLRCYEVALQSRDNDLDLKPDTVDVFKTAVGAVQPKSMIENMLQYNKDTSTLMVQDKYYKINKNVFVVGFGNAVMGMAKCIENMLGHHVVTGIISIPQGMQQEMREAHKTDMLLSPHSRISIYEAAPNNEVDEAAHNASKAIHSLVTKLTEKDLLIVLCSGGGSVLVTSPHPPITLEELRDMTRLLLRNGASIKELNTVRKNIEILKGGGLAMEARPAKVLSLLLSSIIGDPIDLIASGPTYPTQRTPHQCIEIMTRLNILDKVPESIRKFLDRECKNLSMMQAQAVHDSVHEKEKQDAIWHDVQNIIVGNNSIACEAAAARASELGYLPLILTKVLTGEAREIGFLYAKLAKFIMICFDRKACMEPNVELVTLELELVGGGIRKEWINHISNSVDMAHNLNKDICVIAGGETTVHVNGTGVGGKNMESALAAAIQMKEEFRTQEMHVAETRMSFLSCDSDGHDGATTMAGAVVDQDFLDKADKHGIDLNEYLQNNDSFTAFSKVNGGRNLIRTNLTGTNVMDMVIMMVQKPRERKYQWN